MTGRARIELRRRPWARRRGKPDDLLLATFVERLVFAAKCAGYDTDDMPKAWRPKEDDDRPPPLVQFVDTALGMALVRAKGVLDDHRDEITCGDAISKRLAELDELSERAIADRVIAAIKGSARTTTPIKKARVIPLKIA